MIELYVYMDSKKQVTKKPKSYNKLGIGNI